MLERISDLPKEIDGVKASGKVSREDYEKVFAPLLADALRHGRRMRFLYQVGPDFEGFSAGAAWEDVKIGLRSIGLFDGCAVLSDLDWVRNTTRLASFLMPCPVKIFGLHERGDAIIWLRSLPEGTTVSPHLIADKGVLVIAVKEALRTQDFDALARIADPWIAQHGELRGVVIHAREFPGWENIESFLRHARFVRKHYRKVERIALAVDSKLAEYAPRISKHFLEAEVKKFDSDQLEKAIAWAGAPRERDADRPKPKSNRASTAHSRA